MFPSLTNTREAIRIVGPVSSDIFADLLIKYRLDAYLARIARSWLQDVEDVDDAVQETLLAVAKTLRDGILIVDLQGFAAGIIRNKARTIRGKKCRCSSTDMLCEIPSPAHSHEENIDFKELVTVALAGLSDAMRRAFEMVAFEGKSRQDAAEALERCPGTISRWLVTAWKKISHLSQPQTI